MVPPVRPLATKVPERLRLSVRLADACPVRGELELDRVLVKAAAEVKEPVSVVLSELVPVC